ncbi:MAG: ABC transporter ATP-binding protein [bacterium]
MADGDLALACEGIEKVYRKRKVLCGIHLRIREGSVLGLVGPNGAGKTTLLKILAGLVPPCAGTASICGRDLSADPRGAKKLLGFVSSEERSFYWRLSGRDNLRFFAALQGLPGKKREARIDSVLEDVGLGARGRTRFQEYSSGMKQALCLARALLHDPPVLLLDEPTRSLSPDAAASMRALLRRQVLERGKTVLLASHNLTEVEELADEIAVLHEGSIRCVGALADLGRQARLQPQAGLAAIFDLFIAGSRSS